MAVFVAMRLRLQMLQLRFLFSFFLFSQWSTPLPRQAANNRGLPIASVFASCAMHPVHGAHARIMRDAPMRRLEYCNANRLQQTF